MKKRRSLTSPRMYPIEYMTISAPTPETISISVIESWSTRIENGTLKVGLAAQV